MNHVILFPAKRSKRNKLLSIARRILPEIKKIQAKERMLLREKNISVPIIEKIGTYKGKSEYQVSPKRIDNSLGFNKTEAERVKKEYIQAQIKKINQ